MGAALACICFGVVMGPPVFGSVAAVSGGYRGAFLVAIFGPAFAWYRLIAMRRRFMHSR
jgi:hypothetical protein